VGLGLVDSIEARGRLLLKYAVIKRVCMWEISESS
jgi:hypothetical protein